MKKLRFAVKKEKITLGDVPKEYKEVETIASLYSQTLPELQRNYRIGIDAYEKLKADVSVDFFQEKFLWAVRQSIIDAQSSNQV